MKIRIRDNSLRLRITQSELQQFEDERVVRARIAFPGGNELAYSLHWGHDQDYRVVYRENEIRLEVPEEAGKAWLAPDRVGMETHLPLPNGGTIRLLVEKDFACLSERKDEDESDMFPNPNTHC